MYFYIINSLITKVSPLTPSVALIVDKPSPKLLYKLGSTYLLHFTTSNGTIAVCVIPQAKAPPAIHFK